MAVSNAAIIVAAAVIVAAVGAETYVRLQEVRDLRQAVAEISTKGDNAVAVAMQAGTTASQAVARADQAGAAATEAKETADQARALATLAKETADRTASAAAASPAPAQQPARPAGAPDLTAGRDLALQICSACHVVSPDQRFAPTLRPPAPDFRGIANRPATTERSLRDFMVIPHGKMPDPKLVDYQVTALVRYLLSLRDQR
jgi:mono/diheme cytochrome c family protein